MKIYMNETQILELNEKQAQRIIDAFGWNWQEFMMINGEGIKNPLDRTGWAISQIMRLIDQQCANYEARKLLEAAKTGYVPVFDGKNGGI